MPQALGHRFDPGLGRDTESYVVMAGPRPCLPDEAWTIFMSRFPVGSASRYVPKSVEVMVQWQAWNMGVLQKTWVVSEGDNLYEQITGRPAPISTWIRAPACRRAPPR